MARVCTICGKSYNKVTKRSHSMRPTIVRLQPNLQWMQTPDGRVKACTKCIKSKARALQAA